MYTNNIDDNKTYSKKFFALGTVNDLKAFGALSEKAVEESIKRIYEIDDKMSVFKEYSDISKINKNAGGMPQKIGNDTYYVIKKAVYFSELSHGCFDPTIGPIVKLWSIGTDHARVSSDIEIKNTLKLVNYKDIIFDDKKNTVKLKNKNQSIDLGGIAKGFAADEVNSIFQKYNIKCAIIDLGGNIIAVGNKYDGTPWNIGIQDPLGSRFDYIGIVRVTNKSIVTSGNYERFIEINGKRYHHIINPKTGYPCDNGVISSTIISDYSIDGDGLSTYTFTLGLEKALKFTESLKGIDAVFITSNKEVYITSGLMDKFTITNNEYALV